MKKMSEKSMRLANGGDSYYCVCGQVMHTAVTFNIHCYNCPEYQIWKTDRQAWLDIYVYGNL